MLFRVVLVTLFLGSALAVDTTALANFGDLKNATIVGLIVFTYFVTIIYALLLKRVSADRLAKVQLVVDTLTTFALTLITSGLDSVFLFLFYINIINAAVVVGRRFALYLAAATTLLLIGLAAIDLRWVRIEQIYPILRPSGATYLRLGLNAAATFVTGLLAGQLADRLGKATEEIVRQQGDIAQLRALNFNILESLSSGLVTVDAKERIIFFNRAAREITQREEDEVLGSPLEEVMPALWRAIRDSSGRRSEVVFSRPDGASLYLGYTVSELFGAGEFEGGKIIIFQDLSEIKHLEAQMRRSERFAAVGQLAAAIAHEIRNPLASISGSVEMLQHASANPDEEILMSIVLKEVDRLNTLITNFLDYARPHDMRPQPLRLLPLLEDIKALVGERALVDLKKVSAELVIEADEQSFRQIIWNLINNAIEAGNSKAQIRLETWSDSSFAFLAIEDNGDGVPVELREKVFEPFFTTKEKGTGLGLATIFRMMEEHGGNMTLMDGTELGGARFELAFPLVNR